MHLLDDFIFRIKSVLLVLVLTSGSPPWRKRCSPSWRSDPKVGDYPSLRYGNQNWWAVTIVEQAPFTQRTPNAMHACFNYQCTSFWLPHGEALEMMTKFDVVWRIEHPSWIFESLKFRIQGVHHRYFYWKVCAFFPCQATWHWNDWMNTHWVMSFGGILIIVSQSEQKRSCKWVLS